MQKTAAVQRFSERRRDAATPQVSDNRGDTPQTLRRRAAKPLQTAIPRHQDAPSKALRTAPRRPTVKQHSGF
jgi:hypothetical protein